MSLHVLSHHMCSSSSVLSFLYYCFVFFFYFFFFFLFVFFFFFFFFQAEDGIRDLYETGVQTCALPICPCSCRTHSTAFSCSWFPCTCSFTTSSPSRSISSPRGKSHWPSSPLRSSSATSIRTGRHG